MYPQDNSTIYFEPIPSGDMLDPLPEPVMMMKPIPSIEEAPPTKILSFREPGTGEKDGEEEAKDGAGKTDEEIARELHEKLNT